MTDRQLIAARWSCIPYRPSVRPPTCVRRRRGLGPTSNTIAAAATYYTVKHGADRLSVRVTMPAVASRPQIHCPAALAVVLWRQYFTALKSSFVVRYNIIKLTTGM